MINLYFSNIYYKVIMNLSNIIEYQSKYQHFIFLIISIILSNLQNMQLVAFITILLFNFVIISIFRRNIDINLIEFTPEFIKMIKNILKMIMLK